ncbi:MAG: glycosyltransferase family 4 protein [Nanoarchaeota archaeon]|nr:glycosyltransferase family 4 protein [Nanoarchaeota archaeon]MBU1005770.1 glycosyltransferase family 4 protein [Nanoarchaeota archaeon]MBU1946641.1 glycosyltransferase family 4 protein [Nanoarchaeota archaeon]
MKILQINKFNYVRGGAERYFFELSRLLESRGNKVSFFSVKTRTVNKKCSLDSASILEISSGKSKKAKDSSCFLDGIDYDTNNILSLLGRIPKVFFRTMYSFEAKGEIEKLIKREKPDVAHIHQISHQISPSILHSLKKMNVPVVYTLHNYNLICPNSLLFIESRCKTCSDCKGGNYFNVIFNKCMKDSFLASFLVMLRMYFHRIIRIFDNVDVFIAPSRFMKNKCIEFGVDKGSIMLLPYFINVNDYKPSFKNHGYVLYFGRLVKEKAVHTLLESVKGTGAKLFIAGTGPEEENLKKFSEKCRVNTMFLGSVGGEELKEVIRNSSFVVVPSIYYDNLPVSIFESFALGKPVIGSRIGGIPELVEDGKTGFLFEPGNHKELRKKIMRLLNNPDLVIKMGKNARSIAEEKFNQDVHYNRIMDLYRGLL